MLEQISRPPTELVSIPTCTPALVGAIGLPLVQVQDRVATIIPAIVADDAMPLLGKNTLVAQIFPLVVNMLPFAVYMGACHEFVVTFPTRSGLSACRQRN